MEQGFRIFIDPPNLELILLDILLEDRDHWSGMTLMMIFDTVNQSEVLTIDIQNIYYRFTHDVLTKVLHS